MNRNIRILGIALILCFVALFVQLNRIQIFQQKELQENPSNMRSVIRDFNRERGEIITIDGQVIAASQKVDGQLEYERVYPYEDLYAHSTGFFSFQYGADGLERYYNDQLAGQKETQQFNSLKDIFTVTDTSADLTITLNHSVQQTAKEALGERNGSVVVVDPRTGAILAFWSYPSYDPSVFGSSDLQAGEKAWEEFSSLPVGEDPRLPKMYREIFFPGSTFKLVTASAALTSTSATLTEPDFEVRATYTPPLTTFPLQNYAGSTCGGDILEGLRVSCNTTFAELAAEVVGAEALIATSEKFGFNESPPIDLPSPAESVFPDDFGSQVGTTDSEPPVPILENTPALAQSGIGQFNVKATPLQMALVAAAIANDGILMKPHLMNSFTDQSGEIIEIYKPLIWQTVLSRQDALSLQLAMEITATSGTATNLAIPGIVVGGKTGTAQVDAERPDDTHGWIVGYAGPSDGESTLAIAVIVESSPGQGQLTGGADAAPIAKEVLLEALKTQGFLE